jgi:MerR family transcriptional regulator, thiopeptide resistance regulator
MRPPPWKVGELARRTGLTVRTLHDYDEIGLLVPSEHTATGHRLYAAGDVARLQQILSLRELGFRLEQVRDCLVGPKSSHREVIASHLARIGEQIEQLGRLRRRLEAIGEQLERTEVVSVKDLCSVIEAMTMYEKYFSPAQQDTIRARGQTIGQERIEQVGGVARCVITPHPAAAGGRASGSSRTGRSGSGPSGRRP